MNGMEELVIYTFPILGYVIFSTTRFLTAIPATLLTGFLLLPPDYSFNLPILPSVTKPNMIAVTLVALALMFAPRERQGALPSTFDRVAADETLPGLLPGERWAFLAVIWLAVIGPFATTFANTQPVMAAGQMRPGLSLYDVGNTVWTFGLPLLPLLVARKYLGGETGQRALLLALVVAGLVYSLPALLEVRLSPQMHMWVYGSFQHSWIQHLRAGGFRPIVFMDHGLELGIFFAMTLLAALGYIRVATTDRRPLFAAASLYLLVVLFLCKTIGAFLIALVLLPVMLFLKTRMQLLAAAAIALFVITYPAVRAVGISPFGTVANVVAVTVSESRANSLRYRLAQEDLLIGNALRRPLVGWGGYARVFNTPDDETIKSSRDGRWLIIFGERGIIGFVAYFGLLCLPIVLLAARSSRITVSPATAALVVVLAANVLDLVPNSSKTPLTMLIAGALIGRLEHARAPAAQGLAAPAGAMRERHGGRVASQKPAGAQAGAQVAHVRARQTPPIPDRGTGGSGPTVATGASVWREPPRRLAGGASDGARYTRFPVGPATPRRG